MFEELEKKRRDCLRASRIALTLCQYRNKKLTQDNGQELYENILNIFGVKD